MLARFALREDRTLFLFVFATDVNPPKAMNELSEQKKMLRERFAIDKWESPRILDELDRAPDLYFDRVS